MSNLRMAGTPSTKRTVEAPSVYFDIKADMFCNLALRISERILAMIESMPPQLENSHARPGSADEWRIQLECF